MKKLLNIFSFLIGLCLVFCLAFYTANDYFYTRVNEFGAANLENAMDNVVVIETRAVIKNKIKPVIQKAIAIPIGNNLVVALSHATTTKPFIKMRSPFGWIEVHRKIISEKWFIGETEISLIGRKDDISLFRADIPQKFPYKFGNSDKARTGDKLLIIGYPFNIAITVKQGTIASLHYVNTKLENKHAFLIDAAVNFGDSGSPVMVYQNNIFKIIGIVYGVYGQHNSTIGLAFPINYVQETIDEILRNKNVAM